MRKVTQILFLIFGFFSCSANASDTTEPLGVSHPVQIFTLPKSGTWLIQKIMHQLSINYQTAHLTDEQNNSYSFSGRRVINIRDLRDFFSSLRSFSNKVIEKGIRTGITHGGFNPVDQCEEWMSMSADQQLMALITLSEPIPLPKLIILNSIIVADTQVQQSHYDPSILITKFESWIGEKGGGSFSEFSTTLEKTLNHFGSSIEQETINHVYQNYYGDTATFDKGQIGRWKEDFKAEHIAAFKELWNNYLINWGYESDANW